jgi:hypothetical protein
LTSRSGAESSEEVNRMAEKKISPKAATAAKASGSDKAATRVTKKQSLKRVSKKKMGK